MTVVKPEVSRRHDHIEYWLLIAITLQLTSVAVVASEYGPLHLHLYVGMECTKTCLRKALFAIPVKQTSGSSTWGSNVQLQSHRSKP